MQASKLRQRITLLKPSQGASPTGANSKVTFADYATVWANIEPLSVRDVINAQAAGSQARVRCVVRYRRDITSAMRVRHDGKTYKIDGDPLPDKGTGREYLTLMLVSA